MKKNIKKEKQIKIPKKVENFLTKPSDDKAMEGKAGIKYELVKHRTVYTAFDKAATLKAKPEVIAKVLTIKIGRELAMAVIGGNKNLDIEKLQKLAKVEKLDFAKEKAIAETFKGVDPGAVPPFEGLWKMKVFCDKKLLESPKIILSAGKYEASLAITPAAFKKVNPEMAIGNFSLARRNGVKAVGAKKSKSAKKPAKSTNLKPKKKTAKPVLKKKKK